MAAATVDPTERDWIQRAQRGDAQAFDRLVARYYRRVYTLCLRLLDDPAEAEDATQEAFWRAYRHLNRYDPQRPFRPWLLSIAAHHALDRLRRRRRRSEQQPWPDATPAAEEASPEEVLLQRETQALVQRCVNDLPPLDRALVLLRYWEEASYEEMAQALGLTVSAVKSRLFRARRALAEAYLQAQEDADHA